MTNLRGGFKIQGEPLTAAKLDELSGLDPADVEGLEDLVAAIARRADLVVRAGLEVSLSVRDLSQVELEALALAREKRQARQANLLAVAIAQAIRTENLADLVPDDLGDEVKAQKYLRGFEARALSMLEGGGDG